MKRYRIGFFVSNQTDEYMRQMMMGVRSAMSDLRNDLVILPITLQQYDHVTAEMVGDSINLAVAADLDIYIITMSCFTRVCTLSGIDHESLLSQLPKDRTLVLEDNIEGWHCLSKDNKSCIRELVRYLVKDCGFTKIGFFSGDKYSSGSIEREEAFFDEMKLLEKDVPKKRFSRGSFSGDCYDELYSYMSVNKDIEAVMCANDAMALTLYKVLNDMGLRPGRDIAVTGFDDQPSSSEIYPPLTTVSMTSFDIGYLAAGEAVRLKEALEKGEDYSVPRLTGRIVYRSSCGAYNDPDRGKYEKLIPEGETAGIVEQIIRGSVSDRLIEDRAVFIDGLSADVGQIVELCLNPVKKNHLTNEYLDAFVRGIYRSDETGEVNAGRFFTEMEHFFGAVMQNENGRSNETVSNLHMHFALSMYNRLNSDRENEKQLSQKHLNTMNSIIYSFISLDNSLNEMIADSVMKKLFTAGVNDAFLFMTAQQSLKEAGSIRFSEVAGIRNGLVYANNLSEKAGREDELGIRDIFDIALNQNGRHVYSAIPLINDNNLIGYLVADSQHVPYDEIFFASLQFTYSLMHLNVLSSKQDVITMLNEDNRTLSHESMYDELSHLLNRRGFIKSVNDMIRTSYGMQGIFFYLDLDRFKNINDTYGHAVGDDAIKKTGMILKECFRNSDAVCRVGGDEFLIFICRNSESMGDFFIKRITRAMESFNRSNPLGYRLVASVGYKAFAIDGDVDIEAMINAADRELYKVKAEHHKSDGLG